MFDMNAFRFHHTDRILIPCAIMSEIGSELIFTTFRFSITISKTRINKTANPLKNVIRNQLHKQKLSMKD